MGVESGNSYKVSRRSFLNRFGKNVTATVAGAALGAEVAHRRLTQPPPYMVTEATIPPRVPAEAQKLYPHIPLVPVSAYADNKASSITALQQERVITGLDNKGESIYLDLLYGEDLIKALQAAEPRMGFDHALDVNRPIDYMFDKDGNPTPPIKPDGTRWTRRDRVYERPELYNETLRGLLDQQNFNKREQYIQSKTIRKLVPWYSPLDTIQAGIAVLPALLLAIRLGWRGMTKPDNNWVTSEIKLQEKMKEKAEEFVGPHLKQLEELFHWHLLNNVRISRSRAVNFYSLGFGSEGGFDAMAMSILATRYGLKANIACVDSDPIAHNTSVEDWKKLEKMNLVAGEQNVEFRRANPAEIEIPNTDPRTPVVIAVRNIDSISPGRVFRVLDHLLPLMGQLDRQGTDVCLMFTSRTPEALQLLKYARRNQDEHLNKYAFLKYDGEENTFASEKDGLSDQFVSVFAFSDRPKEQKRYQDTSILLLPHPTSGA